MTCAHHWFITSPSATPLDLPHLGICRKCSELRAFPRYAQAAQVRVDAGMAAAIKREKVSPARIYGLQSGAD